MAWNEMKMYREKAHDMYDDYDEDELERAYKRGCKEGYRKAKEEMHNSNGYGERDGGFGNRSWTISEGNRGGYGHREDYEEMGDYGERRYRDARGRFR